MYSVRHSTNYSIIIVSSYTPLRYKAIYAVLYSTALQLAPRTRSTTHIDHIYYILCVGFVHYVPVPLPSLHSLK